MLGYPSVNVQAVCDHRKRFISFDIRPGSWSDAEIFKHSSFGLNIARLLPQGHHVLADSGYGILPSVMTPYNELDEGGALFVKQACFNFNLSSTRMVIEGAFGLLKERFRILKNALEERARTVSVRIIVACLVLHNLLIDLHGSAPITSSAQETSSADDAEAIPPVRHDKNLRTKMGMQKRNDIASLFV